ncbi:hypothetical protein BPOR_0167g00060 [Botrytis porri]|uniref:Phosphotransferase n=1 Tax=Botrytis porri TaxID=87229 RepID=A0A4Z1KUZ0_9HELO|nr:hypothetical protein BPOR_0167g00060 [Botrytis porri]
MTLTPTALDQVLTPLEVDINKIHALAKSLCETFKTLAKESTNQFLPTPISEEVLRPDHEGKGRYLAIDIGGSNLRVGFIELLGPSSQDGLALPGKINRLLEKSWQIGEDYKYNNADELFVWVGKCIAKVVQDGVNEWGLQLPSELPMGVTMSFPMIQNKLSDAILMSMGKGFAMTSNLNLGEQLLKGYKISTTTLPHLPRIKITAIVNDAVASLVSFQRQQRTPYQKVAMGLIVGTGCNATIPLSISKLHVTKYPSHTLNTIESKQKDTKIIINTEWSINGTAPPLHTLNFITKWDKILDANSETPGFMPFEYMTGGKYLGELGRLIILDYFTTHLQLPSETLPTVLRKRNALDASILAKVGREDQICKPLDLAMPFPVDYMSGKPRTWTPELANVVVSVAKKIEKRAAGMVAAAIIGLLAAADELPFPALSNDTPKTKNPEQTNPIHASETITELLVGYTGSCISHFQDYLPDCQMYLDDIMRQEFGPDKGGKKIVLEACTYGSIIGAGILAGTVEWMEESQLLVEESAAELAA